MAESKRISDLIAVEDISMNDLLLLSSFVEQDNYESRKAGLGLIALAMLSDFTFDDVLRTTSKNIIGAINELNSSNVIDISQTEGKYTTKGAWSRVGDIVSVSVILRVNEQYSTTYATLLSGLPPIANVSGAERIRVKDTSGTLDLQLAPSGTLQNRTALAVGQYLIHYSYPTTP